MYKFFKNIFAAIKAANTVDRLIRDFPDQNPLDVKFLSEFVSTNADKTGDLIALDKRIQEKVVTKINQTNYLQFGQQYLDFFNAIFPTREPEQISLYLKQLQLNGLGGPLPAGDPTNNITPDDQRKISFEEVISVTTDTTGKNEVILSLNPLDEKKLIQFMQQSADKKEKKKNVFQPQISTLHFPDRSDAIVWHTDAIKRGFADDDYEFVNLSYAKLIESIRQQNVNDEGKYESQLSAIRAEYDDFRAIFLLEYPKQFLPPAPKGKPQAILSNQPKFIEVTSNNVKLDILIKEIGTEGHPEYPLLRKEYAVTSGMPCRDFSSWVIEQLKLKDYNSLYAFVKEFYLGRDDLGGREQGFKRTFEHFLEKDFRGLFIEIDEQAIFEIQAFFILKRGIDDFNREFWIAADGAAELLCSVLSVHSFTINTTSFEPLIKKANKFLREMRRDNDFWKEYKNYKIESLETENAIDESTPILPILKQITPGERIHFFDFAKHSCGKFWTGGSSSKTRSYGINENISIAKMLALDLFEPTNDINAIPSMISKGELKEAAEEAGFEIKKSWTMMKIFEMLSGTIEGQAFLQGFMNDKRVLQFKQSYGTSFGNIRTHKEKIKPIVDLLAMI